MKRCGACYETKPLEDFNVWVRGTDGRQPRCRECSKAQYQLNKAKYVAAAGERSRRVLDDYRGRIGRYLLDHPCVDCGEVDVRVLEFDHRPGQPKTENIATLVRKRVAWTSILSEIEKCDVRCVNCHRRKTSERGADWRQRWWLENDGAGRAGLRLASILPSSVGM